MSEINLQIKSYDELIFETTRLNIDIYLLKQKLEAYENMRKEAIEYIMSELVDEWSIKNDGCVSGSDLPVYAITPLLNILNKVGGSK